MERYVFDFIELAGKIDEFECEDLVSEVGIYLDENTKCLGWDLETYEEQFNSSPFACHGYCEDADKMEADVFEITSKYNLDVDPDNQPCVCIYYPDRCEMTQIFHNGYETYDDYDYDNGGLQRFFSLYHPFNFEKE